MDLERFALGLANLIGKPSSLRPFVCEGSPLKCRIFIVGHNPATPSDRDLWSDWGPHGFDKAKWMRAYLEERANRPLKPGKTFRPKVSPSRRVIDQVIAAAGVPILEPNIFAGPSPDMQSLRKRDIAPDLPPVGPSIITRVCRFEIGIRGVVSWQARRARSHQGAQASGALRAASGCRARSAA